MTFINNVDLIMDLRVGKKVIKEKILENTQTHLKSFTSLRS